ncbi:hypothetical protein [Yoonia sp. R2-816]|uniref:hypothetical protein n=1 Tax=Yoonia sp. R2-816 TaxID=3342638 RepID=UPI00372C103A
MFIGQFPTDECVAVDQTDCVTHISSHRKFMAGKRNEGKDTPQRSKPIEIDPFPKVDDIIDRLTSDTEVADLRIRARS